MKKKSEKLKNLVIKLKLFIFISFVGNLAAWFFMFDEQRASLDILFDILLIALGISLALILIIDLIVYPIACMLICDVSLFKALKNINKFKESIYIGDDGNNECYQPK